MTETLTKDKTRETKVDHGADQPLRVCFVCTGNTCRSPMAQAVANALAAQTLTAFPPSIRSLMQPPVEAFSAGLYANDGEPIASNAVAALENASVASVAAHDYHAHTAHTLTEAEADQYDLLIGLSDRHVFELLMRFPNLAQRIVRMPKPIPDPFGGDLERYTSCLAEITEGVKELLFAGTDV